MAKQYNRLPSEILGIHDDYTAFCFNEACTELLMRISNEEKPIYIEHREQAEKPEHYNNFKDFYKTYGG